MSRWADRENTGSTRLEFNESEEGAAKLRDTSRLGEWKRHLRRFSGRHLATETVVELFFGGVRESR